MRTIRLDDYPNGNPGYDIERCREDVTPFLDILESYNVPYLLGASPLLMDGGDIQFLNEKVRTGYVVMHGFDHHIGFMPWKNIVDTWPLGGEFSDMDEQTISMEYDFCTRLLGNLYRYDHRHFIPPFNTYTQSALNVLSQKGVQYFHTCDKEFEAYGYDKYRHEGITPVISRFQRTYDYAHKVLQYLQEKPEDKSQVTLHWIFDRDHKGWQDAYHRLCEWIIKEDGK